MHSSLEEQSESGSAGGAKRCRSDQVSVDCADDIAAVLMWRNRPLVCMHNSVVFRVTGSHVFTDAAHQQPSRIRKHQASWPHQNVSCTPHVHASRLSAHYATDVIEGYYWAARAAVRGYRGLCGFASGGLISVFLSCCLPSVLAASAAGVCQACKDTRFQKGT
jgi:hypothetical protein